MTHMLSDSNRDYAPYTNEMYFDAMSRKCYLETLCHGSRRCFPRCPHYLDLLLRPIKVSIEFIGTFQDRHQKTFETLWMHLQWNLQFVSFVNQADLQI